MNCLLRSQILTNLTNTSSKVITIPKIWIKIKTMMNF